MAESRKKVKKHVISSTEDQPLPKGEQVKVDQLLAQAILRYKEDLLLDKKIKFKETAHLYKIIEEYMSSFILIGYTMQDEEVIVFNAPTSKDETAISELLRIAYIDIMEKRS